MLIGAVPMLTWDQSAANWRNTHAYIYIYIYIMLEGIYITLSATQSALQLNYTQKLYRET